ncbi:MAG: OmpA family protein [Bacteroidia bacterium]|nr:OmpA family protein [Bacteroidia bacterium]
MQLLKTSILILLLSLCFGVGKSQSDWVKKGDNYLEKGDYPAAIERYLFAVKKKQSQPAMARLAQVYRQLNNYREAVKWARKAANHSMAGPKDHFLLGQAFMSVSEYDSAAAQFVIFRTQTPDQGRVSDLLDACAAYERLLGDTTQYKVKMVSFNSDRSDFSPAFWKDSLIFASARDRDVGVIYTSRLTEAPLLDLYYTSAKEDGKWRKPRPLPGDINSRFNEGPLVVLPGDTVMYLTRNEFGEGSNKGVSKLDLYVARLKKGSWTDIESLPLNGKGFSTGHPTLSPDGKFLVFASNRPGGFGKSDLYVAEILGDGKFGPAVNLGPEVNSEGDEMFPFYHPGGTLYFSSDGQYGLGDLDIFSAVRLGEQWTRVRNVGGPINSPGDDFGFILDKEQKSGFFSSNRDAKDEFDDNIYAFSVLRPEFECQPMEYPELCVTFFEKGTLPTDETTLPLVYEWDLGDGVTKRVLEVDHCYAGPGTYHVKLNVVDTTSGFLFYTEAEYDFTIPEIRQVFLSGPEFGQVQMGLPFHGANSRVDGCEIQEYYWDMGDGARYKGEQIEHYYARPGDYEITLGVIGYDSLTNSECKKCATRMVSIREGNSYIEFADSVQAVRDEFIAKNNARVVKPFKPKLDTLARMGENDIGGARILEMEPMDDWKVEPRFETRTLEDPSFSVKVTTSKDSLGKNPRDFNGIKDIREVKKDGEYNYLLGNEKKPEALYPLYVEVLKLGFDQAVVIAHHNDSILSPRDSNFFFQIPGLETPVVVSVVEGVITDFNGKPLQAKITVEDLKSGKIFLSTRSDEKGKYYLELPNGKIYSFYSEMDGFVPVSDNIDLRNVTTSMRFKGNIKAISIEEMVNTGALVRINNIFFDFDKATLRPESRSELDRLALILLENKQLSVEIHAHTDNYGSDAYNLDLSRRRAASVMRYLALNWGIRNITSQGFGESHPIKTNDTEEGRQFNRRVEFKLNKQ